MTLSKRKEWVFRGVLILGSLFFLFLVLLAAEFSLRLYGRQVHGGQEGFRLHWARLAGETGVYKPLPGVINQLGFHSREIPVDKKANTFRILVLGGSAVYGWKEIETSWVWYLEKNLQAKYPERDIQVVNAGVSGGRSLDQFKLLSKVIHLDPDVVMTYDGWNDVYNAHYCPDWFEEAYRDTLGPGRSELFFNQLNQKMEHRSYLFLSAKKSFYKVRKAIRKKRTSSVNEGAEALTGDPAAFENAKRPTPEGMGYVRCAEETLYTFRPEGEIPDRFSKIYQESLEAMSSLSREHRIPFISILQPSLAYSVSQNAVPNEAVEILRAANGPFFEDWLNASRHLYPKARQVMQNLREKGVLTYDFSTLLEGREALYYTDAVHYKDPTALDLIAQKVEGILRENDLLPESANA